MQTALYDSLSDVTTLTPPSDEKLTQVNDDYIAMATTGAATTAQRERLVAAGAHLASEQNAQAVLLGGTDLNLVYANNTLNVPVIDSAKVHVDAIVEAALG
jgi:aspartate racemase